MAKRVIKSISHGNEKSLAIIFGCRLIKRWPMIRYFKGVKVWLPLPTLQKCSHKTGQIFLWKLLNWFLIGLIKKLFLLNTMLFYLRAQLTTISPNFGLFNDELDLPLATMKPQSQKLTSCTSKSDKNTLSCKKQDS